MSQVRVDPKIIDLLNKKKEGDAPFASLEFFPPRTAEGVKNLYARLDRMKSSVQPLFTDVTWGAGGSTADLSLDIAMQAHNTNHVANLHMTCTNMGNDNNEDPKVAIKGALQKAYDGGIRNIVALRGDPPAGEDEWKAAEGGFTCALDLVVFIRETFGQEYGISVAGYPEGHPNAITEVKDPTTMTDSEKARSSVSEEGVTYTCKDEDYKKEMDYLKKKVDAGSDFIITQMFFDPQVFIQFVKDCRQWGIHCPIVPGLMCLNAYGGFTKMAKFCKTRVPPALLEGMTSRKDQPDAVKAFGIEYFASVCKTLMDETPGGVVALHFYTLNLEKVVYGILGQLGLMTDTKADETDAATQAAVGSAWARVGDKVKCGASGKSGVVTNMKAEDGTAIIKLDDDGTEVTMAKGDYEKVF